MPSIYMQEMKTGIVWTFRFADGHYVHHDFVIRPEPWESPMAITTKNEPEYFAVGIATIFDY